MIDPRVLNLPASITEAERAYHLKLVKGINAAQEGIHRAHAEVTYATQNAVAANKAMESWINHLTEVYSLKPNDVVDANGNLGYQDQGWMTEMQTMAAKRARQAEDAQAAAQAPAPPPPGVRHLEVVPLPTPPEGAEDSDFPEGDFQDEPEPFIPAPVIPIRATPSPAAPAAVEAPTPQPEPVKAPAPGQGNRQRKAPERANGSNHLPKV